MVLKRLILVFESAYFTEWIFFVVLNYYFSRDSTTQNAKDSWEKSRTVVYEGDSW